MTDKGKDRWSELFSGFGYVSVDPSRKDIPFIRNVYHDVDVVVGATTITQGMSLRWDRENITIL